MQKTTLYQKNSNGKIKQWSTWVTENQNGTASIWVEHGQQDGKLQLVETVISEGKNTGKKNATTPFTQAVADATSDLDKKIKKGYVTDINSVQASHFLGSGIPSPMTAEKFDPTMKQKGSKNLDKLKIVGKPCYTQVKLDGTRCLAKIKIKPALIQIQLYARSGDPYYNFPHIISAIEKGHHITTKLAEVIETGEEKEIWLDGELYSHDIPFNQLSGLIRKEKRTEEDLIKQKHIKFYIYDVVSDVCYSKRFEELLHYVDNDNIIMTPTNYIESMSHEILTTHLKNAEEKGYEGLMIRTLESGYIYKRTWNLMKFKSFVDAEYKVVGFKKSITGETLGSIEFENESGERFFSTFNGSDEEQKNIWDNQVNYLGLWGTIKYQELTEGDKGVPRFGKCIKFRKGPSKD